MSKLQGKKLADVVAEVLTEQEQAERVRQKAEVKRVVEQVQRDLAGEKRCQQLHLDAAEEAGKRVRAIQDRLKKIKAGDQAALKLVDSVSLPFRDLRMDNAAEDRRVNAVLDQFLARQNILRREMMVDDMRRRRFNPF